MYTVITRIYNNIILYLSLHFQLTLQAKEQRKKQMGVRINSNILMVHKTTKIEQLAQLINYTFHS